MGFAIILIATPLILLSRGYFFPSGNQGQEIPPIMAIIDPELFRGDFAIQSYLLPGVRFYYQELIALLVGQLGMEFSVAYFTLYAMTLVSFISGIFYIGTYILISINKETTARTSFIFFVGLLVYIFSPFYSWGSGIMPNSPIPSAFAMGISVWGVYYAIQDKWIHSYALFGLAALMQFLVGFLPALIFSVAFIRHILKNRSWATGTLSIIGLGLGLSLVYIPMSIYAIPAPAGFDMLSIFGLYRVPHHWAPSTGNIAMWLSDSSLMLAGLIISINIYRNKINSEAIKNIALICGSAIIIGTVCIIANYLFVEIYPITLIGKLQFQRIIPFAHLSAIILIFILSHELWRKKQYGFLSAIILAPLFMLWGCIILSVIVLYKQQDSTKKAHQWIVLGLSLFMTPLLHYLWHMLTGAGDYSSYGLSSSIPSTASHILLACSLCIATLLLTSNRKSINTYLFATLIITSYIIFVIAIINQPRTLKPQSITHSSTDKLIDILNNRLQLDSTNNIPLYSLATYLCNNTDIDEVVMLPPVGPFDCFQIISKRSAYYVNKNVPYSDYHIWEWATRDSSLLGAPIKPYMAMQERENLFSKRAAKDLSHLAKTQGISYIISRFDWHKDMPGTLIKTDLYQNELWALWRLP